MLENMIIKRHQDWVIFIISIEAIGKTFDSMNYSATYNKITNRGKVTNF